MTSSALSQENESAIIFHVKRQCCCQCRELATSGKSPLIYTPTGTPEPRKLPQKVSTPPTTSTIFQLPPRLNFLITEKMCFPDNHQCFSSSPGSNFLLQITRVRKRNHRLSSCPRTIFKSMKKTQTCSTIRWAINPECKTHARPAVAVFDRM